MKKFLFLAATVAFLGTAFAQEKPAQDSCKAKKECKDKKHCKDKKECKKDSKEKGAEKK